jgi:hypothetical protein
LGLIRNKIENNRRKIPKIIIKIFCGTYATIYAPIMVINMLGTPNSRISRLSRPWRKNVVAPKFADRCVMATSTSAVLKSTKNNATGKNMVDVPNPTTVPNNYG